MYSFENPVSFAISAITSLSYNFIPNCSATNFPIYLPPEPYSLDIVIITLPCKLFVLFSLIFETSISEFSELSDTLLAFDCSADFKFLISLIRKIDANKNAMPSAVGPAYNNPLNPNNFPKTIIDGIKIIICLEIELRSFQLPGKKFLMVFVYH